MAEFSSIVEFDKVMSVGILLGINFAKVKYSQSFKVAEISQLEFRFQILVAVLKSHVEFLSNT